MRTIKPNGSFPKWKPCQRWLPIILCLALLAPTALAKKHLYKLQTTGGDTYYVIALALEVACPGKPSKKIRQPLLVEKDGERPIEWNQFPTHRLEKSLRGYDLIVAEEGEDGKTRERVAGHIDLTAADQRCRHALRARGLGFDKSFHLGTIQWPLEEYE